MRQRLYFVLSLLLTAGLAHADAPSELLGVRFSTTPEQVRIVVDLAGPISYTDTSSPGAPSFELKAALAKALPPVTIDDPIVPSVQVTPGTDGTARVTVTLRQPRKLKVFTLPSVDDKPHRLVIDVLKRFSEEERRALTPAITYTRLEEQTDARYLAAHVVEVDTRDPQVRLAVVPAQGERERVASMVSRTGAVCGVNGGFFLAGTRPVGLVKCDGLVMSLPLWGRTALAVPAQGPPVLDNPRGVWRMTLPDGVTMDLPDGLDASILTPLPPILVYAGQNFQRVGANAKGRNVLVQEGVIIGITNEAAQLLPGQFAIVIREPALTPQLAEMLAVGAPVQVTPIMAPAWDDYPGALGAGPRLLRNGVVEITGEVERFKPDILQGRAARTALGVAADGRVLLVVVEAPGAYGGGATLREVALLLKDRGALDALNFDGGGSSHLALGADTVNYPPATWLRPVANSLVVFDARTLPQ